ncbi:acyl-CoA dehydrogenase family protein [Actinoplanes sp. NPDC051859]|uniref:acyl-CoA dehydrogenase family protein n=1 Tax=Actinoplanes sp. NPDC051859 TaxID=3363909 RepID=UPI00378DC578
MTLSIRDLRESCAELFATDLAPMLRRLGERAPGDGTLDPDDAAIRASVWDTLADLGALRPGPLAETTEVAELIGGALYQSPWAGTHFAADLLPDHAGVGGTAAVAVRDNARAEPGEPGPLRCRPDGTLDGTRSLVAFAADVDRLVVVSADGDRLVAAVIDPRGPSVRLRRHDDIARGDLYEVTLTGAPIAGEPLDVTRAYPAALARARVRQAAYLAGSVRGAIEVAVAHLRERAAFGQPLARMQALAYRFAALTARNAAVLSFARASARRADDGVDVRLSAAQVLLLASRLARETAAEVVHAHGAYGMTEACDAQLFYRRAAVDTAWLGTPTALRREAGHLLATAVRDRSE